MAGLVLLVLGAVESLVSAASVRTHLGGCRFHPEAGMSTYFLHSLEWILSHDSRFYLLAAKDSMYAR